eukprot:gene14418-18403_t
MLDYVWDFGSLTPNDEKLYINQFIYQFQDTIVPNRTLRIPAVLAAQIAISQNFIRDNYSGGSVSMRDVRRVKILFEWFMKNKLPLPLPEQDHSERKAC